MIDKPRDTVWSYMSRDEDNRPKWCTVFFYAGSIAYHGGWMKCTDSFWIVPTQFPWLDDAERR
jgi:hypothetical protein